MHYKIESNKVKTMKRTFIVKDSTGKEYRWTFWRDGYWFLQDYTGYTRTLERNWVDSVSRIHSILDGHGMTSKIN